MDGFAENPGQAHVGLTAAMGDPQMSLGRFSVKKMGWASQTTQDHQRRSRVTRLR